MVQLVQETERIRARVGWPYRRVCRELDIKYSSLMRWKFRHETGEEVLERPGPGPVEQLDIVNLHLDILALSHGEKRTAGTGALYEIYRRQISRRVLTALVGATRRELQREREMMMRRIEWKAEGLVWSMDGMEDAGNYLHTFEDLGSKYKMQPVIRNAPVTGEDVAVQMALLCKTEGAPLFMKRDNHSNMNNTAVNQVLGLNMVIPLNSPAYYAPYNGAMERSQGEVRRQLEVSGLGNFVAFAIAYELALHNLNHKTRRSLGLHTSCERFSGRKELLRKYDKRRRKEVFEEILAMAVGTAEQLGLKTVREVDYAWRLSVESWLHRHGYITVSINGKVLPYFP